MQQAALGHTNTEPCHQLLLLSKATITTPLSALLLRWKVLKGPVPKEKVWAGISVQPRSWTETQHFSLVKVEPTQIKPQTSELRMGRNVPPRDGVSCKWYLFGLADLQCPICNKSRQKCQKRLMRKPTTSMNKKRMFSPTPQTNSRLSKLLPSQTSQRLSVTRS